MKLSDVVSDWLSLDYQWDRPCGDLFLDSRQLEAGGVFIAYPGEIFDGRDHITQAIKLGASAILLEGEINVSQQGSVLMIALPQLKQKIPVLIGKRYHKNKASLPLIGVTGTNGKTSIAYLLAQAVSGNYIGTLGYGLPGELTASTNTTPDGLTIQRFLQRSKQMGACCLALEVSSHALSQDRLSHCVVETAVFTNLTHEHLDYHQTMDEYCNAKARLFALPGLKHAVLNSDCPWHAKIQAVIGEDVTQLRYSLSDPEADIYCEQYQCTMDGVVAQVVTPQGKGQLHAQLLGEFNLSNALAVLACLLIHGKTLSESLALLTTLAGIPGRMECLRDSKHNRLFIVDYAHTPDALENALNACAALSPKSLWCVMGCGGGRDKDKRPLMGKLASTLSEQLIITNDNPRTESEAAIASDIIAGVEGNAYECILDRSAALAYCYQYAPQGAIVLVAGKGHEDYQLIANKREFFSDQQSIQALLKE